MGAATLDAWITAARSHHRAAYPLLPRFVPIYATHLDRRTRGKQWPTPPHRVWDCVSVVPRICELPNRATASLGPPSIYRTAPPSFQMLFSRLPIIVSRGRNKKKERRHSEGQKRRRVALMSRALNSITNSAPTGAPPADLSTPPWRFLFFPFRFNAGPLVRSGRFPRQARSRWPSLGYGRHWVMAVRETARCGVLN